MNVQSVIPVAETAGAAVADRDTGPTALLPQPLRALRAALDQRGIRYCHWKSNIRLARALTGLEDVDLLVHREDAVPFQAALAEAGFRRTASRAGLGHPGVFHALALDEAGCALIHLHAYLQIVGGDSLVKSYRLPVEPILLNGCRLLHGWPIPTPEAELAVFLLRVALKHADPVEAVMANRGYPATVEELAWLREQADETRAIQLLGDLVPGAAPDLFTSLVQAIGDPRALGRRIRLGLRLAWSLRGLRRLGPIAELRSRLHRVSALLRRRAAGRRDMVLETGGTIVALVGPKATGKSTLGDGIAESLSAQLDVIRIHAGKPPVTMLSAAPRVLLPLARRLFPGDRPSAHDSMERRRARGYSLLYVLRMTLLAYDRRALLRRSRRAAAAGAIVVSDRYPSATSGAIDSSCFDEATIAACPSAIKRWLMRQEHRLHAALPRPGLVLRLEAPMETAIRRDAERSKPEGPDAAAVIRRWQLETHAEFPGTPVVLLRTDIPLQESLRRAVREVWSHI
jgi:predicted kinase